MARIAIGGFLHETNCFVPGSTDWSQFAEPADRPGLSRGQEIMDRVVPTIGRESRQPFMEDGVRRPR